MLKRISEQLSRIEQSGYIPLMMVTVCIQGGIIISQFIAAFFITPSEIGVIRAIESVLSILVLIGGFGMQSLSIREVSANQGWMNRFGILRDIYIIIIFGALLVIFGVFLLHEFFIDTIVVNNILLITGVVLLTNAIRVTSGFTQGTGIVGKTYSYLIVSTIATLAINVIAASYWSVIGWIIGRYISEFLTLLVLISITYKLVGPINHYPPISVEKIKILLCDGLKINIALVVKLIGDNVPILMMAALKFPTEKIGFLGLALLAINSSMLPLAVLAQRAFPLMSSHGFQSKEIKILTKKLVRTSFKLAFLVSVILSVMSVLLYEMFGGVYKEAFLLTAALSWSVPLKSIALAYGTNLVATSQLDAAIRVNLIEVMMLIIIGLISIKVWGSFGLVCAIIMASSWSAIAYWSLVNREYLKITDRTTF
jgi:O-antigen/teichoic acid export membrane protein